MGCKVFVGSCYSQRLRNRKQYRAGGENQELSFRRGKFEMAIRYLSRDVYALGPREFWARNLYWSHQLCDI